MITKDDTISRAQSGDEGAFVDLMRAHYAFVNAVVIGIVNNPQDAEEIVQDTFLNAYRGLPDLEDTKKFKNWLAKIARNRALNRLREGRIDTVSINEVGEQALPPSDAPDEKLILREQRELIRRAIETLSPKEREVARSYYLEGSSYDELTRTHGLSYKAISVRLSRAKQKLAKRLGHLLTGVFAFPASTLKQIYSGGLTVMKIGTVPKITAGVVAIIVLAFIGTRQFISPNEDSSPSVEIVTSTESANSRAQTDAARKNVVTAPLPEDKPQISAEEMQQIEDFFAQLDEADVQSAVDTPQSLPDTEVAQNTDEHVTTDTDAFAEGTAQSAEDVMNAYLEALRNSDVDTIRSLLTDAAKEEFESNFMGELPQEILDIVYNSGLPEDVADETLEMIRGMMQPTLTRMLSQADIVSSEYVGDEFHFRLRVPPLKMQEMLGMLGLETSEMPEMNEVPAMPAIPDSLQKMRNEDGEWRIYKW